MLSRESDLELAGEAESAGAALELARQTDLDMAIVDVLLPTRSGISLVNDLFEQQPSCRVLALSVIDEPSLIADMMRAHARGYALKTQPPSEIVDAIRCVLRGGTYLPPTVSSDRVSAELKAPLEHPLARLTKREREVFELVIRGHTNDEIASQLGMATRTAETHRQRMMRKLSAHSVAQLQRVAAMHAARSAADVATVPHSKRRTDNVAAYVRA